MCLTNTFKILYFSHMTKLELLKICNNNVSLNTLHNPLILIYANDAVTVIQLKT